MNNKPLLQDTSVESNVSGSDEPASAHPFLGSACLVVAAVIIFLSFVDETMQIPFMPRSWYTNRPVWYFFAVGGLVASYFLLRARIDTTAARQAARSQPIFGRVVLYTKKDCHLCDDAKQLLLKYQEYFPEIEETDIETDPHLLEQYAKCIPVIEIDGKVRFRGRVNEVLLRRLIDGKQSAE